MPTIRIATRGSRLALWQTNHITNLLTEAVEGLKVEVEIIRTKGDKILDVALSKIGDKGLFTKELEKSLLDNRADIAVHSLKDMQTTLPQGLVLGCITERGAPEDALIAPPGTTVLNLQQGATVATGSVRRKAQLLHLRPDLNIVDIRGNVETRIKRFVEAGYDGMILARAGLIRLGLTDQIAQVIPSDTMVPAVGQGVIGIEARSGDQSTLDLLAKIEHPPTRIASRIERTFLRDLDGGCQSPIAAHATATPIEAPTYNTSSGASQTPFQDTSKEPETSVEGRYRIFLTTFTSDLDGTNATKNQTTYHI